MIHLEIRTATLLGEMGIEPGQAFTFGAEASSAIPGARLAPQHFTLEAGPRGLRVVDLGSAEGTRVDGRRITDAAAGDGARVEAGAASITVRAGHEGGIFRVPPHLRGVVWRSALDASRAAEAAGEVFRGRAGSLHALVDSARGEAVHAILGRAKGPRQSLYAGEHEARLAAVAPYLIGLSDGDSTLDELLAGFGQRYGIYLASRAGIPQILAHLRYLLFIRDPSGRQLYFRYYDPSVLRTFLPVITAEQSDYVFGAADVIWMESERADALIEVSPA